MGGKFPRQRVSPALEGHGDTEEENLEQFRQQMFCLNCGMASALTADLTHVNTSQMRALGKL